jgi:hypothetical protein
VISVLVICSLPQLIIAAFAAVFITDMSIPSIEMFGHNERVVSVENFSSMKIVIVHHLLELITVAEFSHRRGKLTK